MGTVAEFLRKVFHDLTFGTSDELLGAVSAGAQFMNTMNRVMTPEMQDKLFELQRQGKRKQAAAIAAAALRKAQADALKAAKRGAAYQNAKIRKFREEHPYLNVGAGLIGMVPWALAGGSLYNSLAPAGASLMQKMGVSAALGAGEAGLYSFLDAPGSVQQRAESAIGPALVGGAIGAAIPPIVEGGSALVGKLRERMAWPKPDIPGASRPTVDKLLREMVETGDPRKVAAARRELGDLSTLMDLHPAAKFRAEQIAQSGAPERFRILDVLERRAAGQTQRIEDALNRAIGPAEDVLGKVDDMVASMQRRAAPLYERAYGRALPLDKGQLFDLLKRPSMRSAIRKAIARAADAGHDTYALQALDTLGRAIAKGDVEAASRLLQKFPARLTVAEADMLKRSLDDMINAASRLPEKQRVLKQLRDAVVSAADAAAPEYQAARQTAKGYKDIQEAFELGKRAIWKSGDTVPEVFAQRVQQMTPEELEAAKQGARLGIQGLMDWRENPALAGRKLFNTPARAKNLRALLGEKAEPLAMELNAESVFQRTLNDIAGNSATARRLDNAFQEHLGPTLWSRIEQIASKLWEKTTNKARAQFRRELTELLVDQGEKRDMIIRALEQALEAQGKGNRAQRRAREWALKWLRTEFAAPFAKEVEE